MQAIQIAALLICIIALFMTFRAKFILEKVFKKEPNERMVLRVKYIALVMAVAAFLIIFIFG
jgi:hypothetical protein